MSKQDQIFNINTHDLGSTQPSNTLEGTQDLFRVASQGTYTALSCYICGSTPAYKMVAKSPQLDTAELADKGYVCQHCLQHISPTQYALKRL